MPWDLLSAPCAGAEHAGAGWAGPAADAYREAVQSACAACRAAVSGALLGGDLVSIVVPRHPSDTDMELAYGFADGEIRGGELEVFVENLGDGSIGFCMFSRKAGKPPEMRSRLVIRTGASGA